jgi:hypothetical protein
VGHAREVGPDGGAADVLAEPDGEGARALRQVGEDVAERDEVRAQVRDLDADRLLAGDRREDPDLGRREGVGEVVPQAGDLADLDAGRELELVARDARAGDLADDGRIDVEVGEAGDERLGDAPARLAARPGPRLRLLQERAVREAVVRNGWGRGLEEELLRLGLGLVGFFLLRLVFLLDVEDGRRSDRRGVGDRLVNSGSLFG